MAARPAAPARNLKSQLLPMIFPGGINGLPNDSCGSNFALPDIARLDTPSWPREALFFRIAIGFVTTAASQ